MKGEEKGETREASASVSEREEVLTSRRRVTTTTTRTSVSLATGRGRLSEAADRGGEVRKETREAGAPGRPAAGAAELPSRALSDSPANLEAEGGAAGAVRAATAVGPGRTAARLLAAVAERGEEGAKALLKGGGAGVGALLESCRGLGGKRRAEGEGEEEETRRWCARALAALSLGGGRAALRELWGRRAELWAAHLAFSAEEEGSRYPALLAAAALSARAGEKSTATTTGTTLSLLAKFLASRDPGEVEVSCPEWWAEKLPPLLVSGVSEVEGMAAFHLCRVAAAAAASDPSTPPSKAVFSETTLEALRAAAGRSALAGEALALAGETPPPPLLSAEVPCWGSREVAAWASASGFPLVGEECARLGVDGDLLLRLSVEEAIGELGLSGLRLKRFFRELGKLKSTADYGKWDPTGVAGVLAGVSEEVRGYAWGLLASGLEASSLPLLREQDLAEAGVDSGLHRARILAAVRGDPEGGLRSRSRPIDVFLSYRRSNGSQLASLVKVLLELRGFSVFLDVDRLESGRWDRKLLESVGAAKSLLVVLTPRALDRCKEDDECKDWVHREVATALRRGLPVVPLTSDFEWPPPEELPEDMRALCSFNSVRWTHEYQEACLDKLERFVAAAAREAAPDPPPTPLPTPTPTPTRRKPTLLKRVRSLIN